MEWFSAMKHCVIVNFEVKVKSHELLPSKLQLICFVFLLWSFISVHTFILLAVCILLFVTFRYIVLVKLPYCLHEFVEKQV